MFAILALGIGSWVVYGLLKSDPVIVTSNAISLTLLSVILVFKLRERRGSLGREVADGHATAVPEMARLARRELEGSGTAEGRKAMEGRCLM